MLKITDNKEKTADEVQMDLVAGKVMSAQNELNIITDTKKRVQSEIETLTTEKGKIFLAKENALLDIQKINQDKIKASKEFSAFVTENKQKKEALDSELVGVVNDIEVQIKLRQSIIEEINILNKRKKDTEFIVRQVGAELLEAVSKKDEVTKKINVLNSTIVDLDSSISLKTKELEKLENSVEKTEKILADFDEKKNQLSALSVECEEKRNEIRGLNEKVVSTQSLIAEENNKLQNIRSESEEKMKLITVANERLDSKIAQFKHLVEKSGVDKFIKEKFI